MDHQARIAKQGNAISCKHIHRVGIFKIEIHALILAKKT